MERSDIRRAFAVLGGYRASRSIRPAGVAALGAALLWPPAAAQAHHSFSSFDMENTVRVDGVVAEVQWTNPHAWMEVDVTGPDGAVVRWGVEFNSPNNLTRQGWRRTTIQAGDAVSFVVSPLRDGRPGGLFYEVTLPSGELIQDPRARAGSARRAQADAGDAQS